MGKDLKGKELGTGLSQRKDGRYQARFTGMNGKRCEKNFAKITEARNWLSESKHNDGLLCNCNMTVDEWYNFWIKNYKEGIVTDNTKKGYVGRYKNNIKKMIGNMSLTDVKQIHCQQILNKMVDDGYSSGTIKLTRVTLYSLFKCAVANGYIIRNPAENLKLKKTVLNYNENEKRVLTREEQKIFLQYAKKTRHYNAFALVLETGLRCGELGALQWSDIDMKKGFLYVNKTLIRNSENGELYFGSPKSISSRRKIPLTESAKKLLRDQRKNQILLKNKRKNYIAEWDNLIFTTKNGRPLEVSNFKDAIDRIVNNINADRKANVGNGKHEVFKHLHMHSLRHTFATRCIEKGVQPKILQKMLGHSSIQITMDLYVHTTDEHLIDELEKMNMVI